MTSHDIRLTRSVAYGSHLVTVPDSIEAVSTPSYCVGTFSDYPRRMKKIISTPDAPAAIGPYSQAVRVGSTLYCAGQIPLDPKTAQIVSPDITEQTKRVMENIGGILRAERLSFENVAKTTIFLIDFADFQTVNEIYGSYFKKEPPARSTVQVSALPKGSRIEIEVIAVADGGASGGGVASDTSG
jgi:2-iminobutanoate/2-iminopropanoate deaminase